MLALTESTTRKKTKATGLFLWTRSTGKNMIFEKILPIFKSNSSPEDDVTEK